MKCNFNSIEAADAALINAAIEMNCRVFEQDHAICKHISLGAWRDSFNSALYLSAEKFSRSASSFMRPQTHDNRQRNLTMTDHLTIADQILAAIATITGKSPDAIAPDARLIGDGSVLDSMKLVELCLQLEDMANDLGFEFDWTSEAAMSHSRGVFRTAASLTEHFIAQMESGK